MCNRDILVSDQDPGLFVSDIQDTPTKNHFYFLLFEGTFILFYKDKKVIKESQNRKKSKFFLLALLDWRVRIRTNNDGSGSGRSKIIRILKSEINKYRNLYHRERILETSTLSCNEEEEEITKPPTR